jgi:preprotein translocase subunit SecE
MAPISEWVPKSRSFVREVWAETKKVTWPTRNEVINTTIVVIVATFFIGLFLYACDIVLYRAVSWVFKTFGA